MIGVGEYLDFAEREYLGDFIARGGCSVKFVVGTDVSADELRRDLAGRATKNDYAFASVDATTVRVHMIDKVFAEIARQVDWEGTARDFVRRTLADLRFRVPQDGDLNIDGLAELNSY